MAQVPANSAIRTVGVIGAGTMGSGISNVLAEVGLEVVLFDLEDHFLKQSLSRISRNMDRQVSKGALTGVEKEKALGRIRAVAQIAALDSVDFVIEAITENLDVKVRTFQEIDRIAGPNVILASNTSSISITSIASATQLPRKVIGMHFMNPVPMMALVEVVRGSKTSDETVNTTMDLARQMGKTPVLVNDRPGFVSNRILIPMINEAVCCLMEGVATAEAIDSIMKLGMNHPLGPLALADLIGLDVCLDIMEVLHEGFSDSKYRPCPLLRDMVEAGRLGRKSGRGFYSY
jgi:3-hydroxybutyryl-CoA dehydrogenase